MSVDWKLNLSIDRIILIIVAALALAVLAWNWYHPREKVRVEKEFVRVEVPKDVVKIQRVEVPVTKVIVVEKSAAAREMELPADVAAAPEKQITAIGTIPPHGGKTDIAAVIDTASGETELIKQPQRPDLFALPNEKEIGVLGGVDSDRGTVVGIYGRWTFVRVGAFHLSAMGDVTATPEGGDIEGRVFGALGWRG